jgi:hypothetical protein
LQPDTFAGKTIVVGASAAALDDSQAHFLAPGLSGFDGASNGAIAVACQQDFLRMPSAGTVWTLTSVLFLLV